MAATLREVATAVSMLAEPGAPVLVELELLAGAGAEVAELDVRGHRTGVAEVRLAELPRFLAPAGHEKLLVVLTATAQQQPPTLISSN